MPATMTSGSAEEDNWTHYLIIGGVIVVGGLANAALITTLFLFKKVNKVGAASHPSPPSASAQERSEVPSSVEKTCVNIDPLSILDINDWPPITPLIVGKPRVGGPYDPLLTGGGASFAAPKSPIPTIILIFHRMLESKYYAIQIMIGKV